MHKFCACQVRLAWLVSVSQVRLGQIRQQGVWPLISREHILISFRIVGHGLVKMRSSQPGEYQLILRSHLITTIFVAVQTKYEKLFRRYKSSFTTYAFLSKVLKYISGSEWKSMDGRIMSEDILSVTPSTLQYKRIMSPLALRISRLCK